MPITPQFTKNDVEVITEEQVYKGFYGVKRFTLKHKCFAGDWTGTFERELIMRHRVAAALPYDPKRKEVVLIEQFRIGARENESGPWLLGLVAGIADKDETLENLIKRECQEEAGIDNVQKLIPICDYWVSPGGSNERVKLFCALVDSDNIDGIHGLAQEHEDIRVLSMPAAEAFASVRDGHINNAATIMALQWLELNLDKI